MKRALKIGILLWSLLMTFSAIGLQGCNKDDKNLEEEIYEISSKEYMFKYENTITILKEIRLKNQAPNNSNNGKYYSKTYKTNLGDTLTIRPHISIYVKNDNEIDEIVKQFGNKLSFNKKVGWVFVYDCNVSNSDEVLEITTQLCKDKNVIACDAFTDIRMESFNTLYSTQYYLHDNATGSVGIK